MDFMGSQNARLNFENRETVVRAWEIVERGFELVKPLDERSLDLPEIAGREHEL